MASFFRALCFLAPCSGVHSLSILIYNRISSHCAHLATFPSSIHPSLSSRRAVLNLSVPICACWGSHSRVVTHPPAHARSNCSGIYRNAMLHLLTPRGFPPLVGMAQAYPHFIHAIRPYLPPISTYLLSIHSYSLPTYLPPLEKSTTSWIPSLIIHPRRYGSSGFLDSSSHHARDSDDIATSDIVLISLITRANNFKPGAGGVQVGNTLCHWFSTRAGYV